ncbi:MAG: hypothetical protein JNM83_17370 [Myxococcales bacterium]|nr:hypothetical protein [Myxococcales bacterium]
MAEQLTGLAPEGALGYRLLMPTRTPDDMPRLSPPLDATGYQGHYSLCPFQVPYDIRLMDGQTYRVVWTGASGEIISPKTAGAIPGLHFFLTSSVSSLRTEAESSSCDSIAAGTEYPEGECQQPRRIPSLSDFAKQRVRTAFRSGEQRAHFEYLMKRRSAIRLGSEEPPPPKSTSGFNREARRELEQFFRDTRTSALMNALLKQEWEPGKMTERKESFLPLSALSFLPSGI